MLDPTTIRVCPFGLSKDKVITTTLYNHFSYFGVVTKTIPPGKQGSVISVDSVKREAYVQFDDGSRDSVAWSSLSRVTILDKLADI